MAFIGRGDLEYYLDVQPAPRTAIAELADKDLFELELEAGLLQEEDVLEVEQRETLAYVRYYIYLRTSRLECLTEAIDDLQGLLGDSNNPSYERLLRDLTVVMAKKAQVTRSLADLEEATYKAQEMLVITDLLHPERYLRWKDLVTLLAKGGNHHEFLRGAEEAVRDALPFIGLPVEYVWDTKIGIEKLKRALAVTPPGSRDYAVVLTTIATFARMQFYRDKSLSNLNESLALTEMSISYEVAKAEPLGFLGGVYLMKYKMYTKDASDLSMSIKRFEEAAIACRFLADPVERQLPLLGLKGTLRERYLAGGNQADIERSIRITERMLERDPDNLDRYDELAHDLFILFDGKVERTPADFKALNRALEIGQKLVSYQHHPQAPVWLGTLSRYYFVKYRHSNKLDDIDTSIRLLERSVAFDHHPDRNLCLNHLLSRIFTRYKHFGNAPDLTKWIRYGNQLLNHAQSISDKLSAFNALQSGFRAQYILTGDEACLQEAVKNAEQAYFLCPDDDIGEKNYHCDQLALAYYEQEARDGGTADKAIRILREALRKTPRDHKTWWSLSFTLGRCLPYADHEEAVALVKAAVEQVDDDQSETSEMYITLANLYGVQWRVHSRPEDQDTAIHYARCAARLARPGSQEAANYNLLVSYGLLDKGVRARPEDLIEAEGIARSAMNCTESPPFRRIQSAVVASGALRNLGRAEELAQVGEELIHILPLVSAKAMKQDDQQRELREFSNIAVMAVSDMFDVGRDASYCLEQLEFGRGIINGLRFGSRTDVTLLASRYPQLARQFVNIRDELDGSAQVEVNRRYELVLEQEEITREIRNKPGFENFLQPPQVEHLKMASTSKREAVVVINVGDRRSDAIIIQDATVRHLYLPNLKKDDADLRLKEMRSYTGKYRSKLLHLLRWLWVVAVSPILEDLGFTSQPSTDDDWPHVWWVPTGPLTQMPLHAACSSSKSALDYVVSSYIATVKALLHSRRYQAPSDSKHAQKVVLTSMQKTDGASELKFADEEVVELTRLLTSTNADIVALREPTKAELMPEISSSTVFHFAGHGKSDPENPSESCLLLKDWMSNPFTVQDLIGLNLQKPGRFPWLAYLSACSTGESQDEQLYEESINLMNACHAAGFQHVVGSLWEISDRHSVTLAQDVYDALKGELGRGNVALALHKAVRRLRDSTTLSDVKRSAKEEDDNASTESEESGDSSTEEESRGARGLKVSKSASSAFVGDPLIWAAYIHVGI